MKLIDVVVFHKLFGRGVVVAQETGTITVRFREKTSKFVYPDAFKMFLTAENCKIQEEILEELNTPARTPTKETRKAEETVKTTRQENGQRANPKQNNSNAPQVFYVFQGSTFEKEYRGGYIWAPITNKQGTTPHHWTRLLDIREGDIILHGCNGCVQAISRAKGPCYESAQPKELTVENLWDRDGRRVDCDYTYIANPIKTAAYASDIVRLSAAKYSPFNKTGNGNMGYLYEINRELAKIFIKESIRKNPSLEQLDYLKTLLSEDLK